MLIKRICDLVDYFLYAFSDFTCASAIDNLCSICLGVNILSCLSKIMASSFTCIPFGKISHSKALRALCLPLRSIIVFLRVVVLFYFLADFFGFLDSLKISVSFLNLIAFQTHRLVVNCNKFLFQEIVLY